LQTFLKIPCYADLGTLLFEIDKIERAIQKAIREARDTTTVSLPSLSDFSSNEEDGRARTHNIRRLREAQ